MLPISALANEEEQENTTTTTTTTIPGEVEEVETFDGGNIRAGNFRLYAIKN